MTDGMRANETRSLEPLDWLFNVTAP